METYLVPFSGGFFSVARKMSVLYSILWVMGGNGMDRELKSHVRPLSEV